ncbi:MAG: RagB/SusD family nutrient uptake outer membrane protein [Paludibacter sp.]
MIKRNIYIIGLSVLLLIGITGCSQWLDLKPESEIILDDFWQSQSDVESVLAACYRGLTEDAVISRMIVWGELRSDNMITGNGFPNARYDMQKILDGDLVPSNAYASWSSFYSVINDCNTLLLYAPKVVDRDNNFTLTDLHQVQAEAMTLRALCYFYLVRTYKEVPLVEEASINDIQNYSLPKSPEDTIINHIIRDLLYAQKYAKTDFGITAYNKGKITLDAVNTILADVYLWNQQYEKCVETANLVLADKNLKLEQAKYAYSHVFYFGNSTESIFELQFNEYVQKNNTVISMYGSNANPIGEVSFPTTLAYDQVGTEVGAFSPFDYKVSSSVIESANDIRAKDSYALYGGKYFIFKYAGINRSETLTGASMYFYRSGTPNWIVYRLSDLMLMKAEALVELDGEANMKDALSLVNKTYLRSNEGQDSLSIKNYTTKFEMEKLVLRERQRELLFEGKRWFDLERIARRENSTSTLNDYVEHKSSGNTVSLGAPVLDAMYMPIPTSELEANPNLKQNPYYEETSSSSNR